MNKLTMSRVALVKHKEVMYLPLCEVLGRWCGKRAGRVYWGTKPSSREFVEERECLETDPSAQDFLIELYLFHQKNDLTTADASKLMEFIACPVVHKFLNDAEPSVRADVFETMKRVFDYGGFRDGKCPVLEVVDGSDDVFFHWGTHNGGKGRSWGAGRFIKLLGVRYCPYCNADTVYSSVFWRQEDASQDKVIQSELDHFMSRGHYPFFAISLYNLVPSCRRCNGSIKGTEDITFANCLYPYRDEIHKAITFAYRPGSAAAFHGVADDRNLDLEVENCAIDAHEREMADRFMQCFRTRDVYQSLFADEIIDEYQKVIECSSLFDSVLKELSPALSRRGRLQIVLRRSLASEDINQVRFGKVFIDLLG